MQFLLIVGSSFLEDRAPTYEIIGSATTICALVRMCVKTAFLGPNAPGTRCISRLNGAPHMALASEGTVPAGVSHAMHRPGAAPARATTHAPGCVNHHLRRCCCPQPAPSPIPALDPGHPPIRGVANGGAPLYCLPGPCRRDQQGAPGREGRTLVYRSRHWWTRWNIRTS